MWCYSSSAAASPSGFAIVLDYVDELLQLYMQHIQDIFTYIYMQGLNKIIDYWYICLNNGLFLHSTLQNPQTQGV